MGVNWVEVFSVVLTGLVVVFLALVILIFAVKLSSVLVRKVEDSFRGKNKINVKKDETQKKEEVSPCKKENPSVEDGIDEETVAAITAAIKMMGDSSGVTYKVSGIKRKKTQGMSIWGKTGIQENTRVF